LFGLSRNFVGETTQVQPAETDGKGKKPKMDPERPTEQEGRRARSG